MSRQLLTRRLAMMTGTMLILLGALWASPSSAKTNPSQPSLKELISKKTNENPSPGQEGSDRPQLRLPYDQLGRQVPASTVRRFLAATKGRNYALAAEYLDLSKLAGETAASQGPKLARQLSIVLDRALWITPDLLSAETQGDQEDHLHPAYDVVGAISAGDTVYDILLQRITQRDGTAIWKFAGVTVAEIPKLYREFGYGWLEERLPSWLFDVSFLGMHLWLWIMLGCLGLLLYPAAMVITWVLALTVRLVHGDAGREVERLYAGPVRLLIWAILMYWGTDLLGPSIALAAVRDARIVQFIALAWLLARTVDLVAARGRAKLDEQGVAGGMLRFKPVIRILKVLALIVVSFLWLEYMGFNVATLELAGFTISGVAIALASQKTLENFLGAFTLMATQPVQVGDLCRFGTTVGTVEAIGLRATRIRTFERTVLKIANAEFLGMQVHNLSKRDRFWYHPTLRLRYETTPDQIRYLMVEVRRMLYGHPKVLADPLYVRFKGFAEHSLNLEVFAYVEATGYAEFHDIVSDLNLRVMELVAAAGTGFGVPTQIEYAFPGKPLDEQRTQAVETEVEEWKARRALYLPDFPKETIAEIKGSLDYPPEGSPHHSPGGQVTGDRRSDQGGLKG